MTTRTTQILLRTRDENCSCDNTTNGHYWLIDWDSYFKGATGECRVSTHLVSEMGTTDIRQHRVKPDAGKITTKSFEFVNWNGELQKDKYYDLAELIGNQVSDNTNAYYYTAKPSRNYPIQIPTNKTGSTVKILLTDKQGQMMEKDDDLCIPKGELYFPDIKDVPEFDILLTFEWVAQELNPT